MRTIKFRQFFDGQFHYWGYTENGGFTTPLTTAEAHDIDSNQFTGLLDKTGKKVYEGDIVRVYDTERHCICDEWEDCDAPEATDIECKEHGLHKHEEYNDCDKFVCIQEVKWGDYTGYFCEEDTGEFCPALGSDEMEMEIIGNIYENPELLK